MARSTAPEYSRGRVRRAGRAIRNNEAGAEDLAVVENFRASHAHILNAFQASLRNRARGKNITVAQRLKRFVTIRDKLSRRPDFSLNEMQDIAGCRLIFPNIDELKAFRSEFHRARFKHNLLSADDRYDYISRSKPDGYRGIHDVYEYVARSPEGEPWNRLRIELQYRTIYQHAWATAVEVAGLLTDNEHKFGRAAPDYAEFFCLASDLISRTFEASTSCRSDLSIEELGASFYEIDNRIGLTNTFKQYNRVARSVVGIGKNVILIFNKRKEAGERTEYHSFDSFSEAVRKLGELEHANLNSQEPYDVVLVRSVSGADGSSIESAFRNYFADTRDFVEYIEASLRVVAVG